MKLQLSILSLVALAALSGCSSPSRALHSLAQDQRDDMQRPLKSAEDAKSLKQRSQQRAERVRKLLLTPDRECSAADHYYAALVLVECSEEADLEFAHQQALEAAEHGEQRGFRVAAEACDKLMLKRGMMQRYGTQFVWEPVLRTWHLYPIDPNTSDEERVAMGVPPMAQLREQEKQLNERKKSGSARE